MGIQEPSLNALAFAHEAMRDTLVGVPQLVATLQARLDRLGESERSDAMRGLAQFGAEGQRVAQRLVNFRQQRFDTLREPQGSTQWERKTSELLRSVSVKETARDQHEAVADLSDILRYRFSVLSDSLGGDRPAAMASLLRAFATAGLSMSEAVRFLAAMYSKPGAPLTAREGMDVFRAFDIRAACAPFPGDPRVSFGEWMTSWGRSVDAKAEPFSTMGGIVVTHFEGGARSGHKAQQGA